MGNMHLVTGYAGKEHVTSDDQGSFNASFFGEESFVLNGKDKFDYEIISNTEIKIKPGDFYTQGRFIRLQNPVVLNFEVGSQEGARIDSVYIKYEKNLQTEIESCDLIVVDGRNAEELKRVQQQSLKKDAILKGENEAYFLMYNVQFNGLNLSNIQKKFEIKENYKKEFEKFASNADDFLKNKVKQTNETLNSLIEKTDINLKKKFENADLIGELKDLNTKNKTNLVNAINEVFQFGVDKGNKIVSKLNALFDKNMINLEEVANEIDKYDVKYKTFALKRIKHEDLNRVNVFSDKVFLYNDDKNKNEYELENHSQIYDLNTESEVKCTYVSSTKYDFKNSTNLYTVFKNYDNMVLFDDSSNKIIIINRENANIDFALYEANLIRLNDKYLLINSNSSTLNVYDMVERKIIKTVQFKNYSTKFLTIQKDKIYFIDDGDNSILIFDSDFQKIRSIQLKLRRGLRYNDSDFFVLDNVIILFYRSEEERYIFMYDANTGGILKKMDYKRGFNFVKKSALASGILNDDKIYFIKNASKNWDIEDYRLCFFDKNLKETNICNLENINKDLVIFKNNIFFENSMSFFKISKILERR